VNADLAFLLSAVYSGSLAPEHLADLRKSGLTDKIISLQRIRSVPPHMISRLLGFDVPAVRSAMLLPFPNPQGGWTNHVRVKVFPALTNRKRHTIKYLQPRGSAPRLYFVVSCLDAVLEGPTRLRIVEGEKKALAVAQLGLPAVGVCGVEGWHLGGSCELLPDFNSIALSARVVELVPDGDYQTNSAVHRAVDRFAEALRTRNAQPYVVMLPTRWIR